MRSPDFERRIVQSRVVRHNALPKGGLKLRRHRADDPKALKVVFIDFGDLIGDHPEVRAGQREHNQRRRMLPKQRPNSGNPPPLAPDGVPPFLGTEEMPAVGPVEHAIARAGRNRQAVRWDSALRSHYPHPRRNDCQLAGYPICSFGGHPEASPAVELASGDAARGRANSVAPLLGDIAHAPTRKGPSSQGFIDRHSFVSRTIDNHKKLHSRETVANNNCILH